MNTSKLRARVSKSARFGSAVGAAVLLVALGWTGCKGGSEGERCNPLLSHDECGGADLVCSGPTTGYPLPGTCVENYCCPKDPSKSTDPHCNGADSPNCPTQSSGDQDGGGEAAAADAGTDAGSTTDTGAIDAGPADVAVETATD